MSNSIVERLVVSMLGGVELVANERSAADHLADGEDAVSLDGVDADTLPVALCEELRPVRLVRGFRPDLTVSRGDRVERGGRSERFSDVHLLGDRACYREVVLDRLRVACRGRKRVEMVSLRYVSESDAASREE